MSHSAHESVVYLDHAATTPMVPAAVEALTAHLLDVGNPSSLHASGRRARRVVEESRETIAHEELALVYRKQARFADARSQYEQSLALYPDFHLANKNLAILCDLYQRDFGCALQHYEAYQALVPDDAQVAIWIADIKARVGQ